ncbi:MAG: MmgE/PrpD family protein, partial [Bdellovibrionota bacterium]
SIMYIFAVALQDGRWHHVDSYTPARAGRADTVKLWSKISTVEDAEWTKRYHDVDPAKKQFGGRVEIIMSNGEKIVDELGVANAHPFGAKPFKRPDYIRKFDILTEGIVSDSEADRFMSLVERIAELTPEELRRLTVQVSPEILTHRERDLRGIF